MPADNPPETDHKGGLLKDIKGSKHKNAILIALTIVGLIIAYMTYRTISSGSAATAADGTTGTTGVDDDGSTGGDSGGGGSWGPWDQTSTAANTGWTAAQAQAVQAGLKQAFNMGNADTSRLNNQATAIANLNKSNAALAKEITTLKEHPAGTLVPGKHPGVATKKK